MQAIWLMEQVAPLCSKHEHTHRLIQNVSLPVFIPKNHIIAYDICKPASRDTAFVKAIDSAPRKRAACINPLQERGFEKEREGYKLELSSVIQWKVQREREGSDSRKGTLLSPKCFFALSACLTKAAWEFHWRIRLVAFLWLVTSGGFGLCLESQWSNRHVCHFVEHSIDCGWGNNAFLFLKRESVHVVVDHLALVAAVWSPLALPSFRNHCRMYVVFHMSSWKETSLLVCLSHTELDLKCSPRYFNPNCLVDKLSGLYHCLLARIRHITLPLYYKKF